jgi:isoleucyl-tRNA synthetase
VVQPQKVVKTLGADILRLWVAATDYRGEMHVSDEILKRVSDSYRRMRNTQRFLLGNLHGFDPSAHGVAANDMVALDRWALLQASRLQEDVVAAYERYEFHLVYHRIHNFCVVDLGGFYLDVIKDRLYTMPANSQGRRSAQTAMYHVAQAMVRWLAPVLSFTAEEIWHALPGARGDSVFLSTWHELPALAEGSPVDWARLLDVRQAVAKELERLRADGRIGAPLEAEVDIYCDGDARQALSSLGEELRFVFITSRAAVHSLADKPVHAIESGGCFLSVAPSDAPKCVRCWHRRRDVGGHPAHPELCSRCVTNVDGPGEQRVYA